MSIYYDFATGIKLQEIRGGEKMKKLILICLLLVSTSAYAWETYMDKCIKSWIGYPLDMLMKQWGYPDDEMNVAGKKLYVWVDYIYDTDVNTGGVSISKIDKKGRETVFSLGGEPAVNYCKKTIEADENNIIINGSWKGNDCPLLYGGKKLMNSQNKK